MKRTPTRYNVWNMYRGGVFLDFLVYLSYYMIPLLIFYIVGFGLLMKVDVYQEFVKGAKEGIQTVVDLLPTLIGLLMSVGILSSSGALDLVAGWLAPFADALGFDAELIPVSFMASKIRNTPNASVSAVYSGTSNDTRT